MKEINSYIIERLKLSNKNVKLDNYEEKYGKGELKTFSECNVLKIDAYGMKNSNEEFDDSELKEFLNKYFENNEDVWIITEEFKHGLLNEPKINKSVIKDIAHNSSLLLQKVNLLKYKRGYYLKDLNGQIILIIRDFLSNGKIRKIRYIFKLN